MRPSTLGEFLQFSIKNRFPVLIKGKPGIGKSDIVDQATSEANAELIISHPVVDEPIDYKGLPFKLDDSTADFLPFGNLKRLINATEDTVFFLDDLGQASVDVQKACMQLILARRINGYVISDKVTFLAATNRKEDKAGVTGILEPVKSRFISIVELDVNAEDWVNWALTHDQPTELISFIKFRPQLLDDFKPSKDIVNSPFPRTVTHLGKIQAAGLKPHLEFEAFAGAAGEAFAVEYCAFLQVIRELPSVDQIVLNPHTTPVPEKADSQYALAFALARRANDNNFQAIHIYLKRMEVEFSVSCVKAATDRDPSLCNTRPFLQWSSEKTGMFI